MPHAVFSLEDARRIRDVVRWYEARTPPPLPYRRRRPVFPRSSLQQTRVMITASDPWDDNQNRWWYGGYQVTWDHDNLTWMQATSGLVFSTNGDNGPRIINGMEASNPATTDPPRLMGNGIYCGTFTEVTVTLEPVRGSPVVVVTPLVQGGSAVAYVMHVPNAVSVECNT